MYNECIALHDYILSLTVPPWDITLNTLKFSSTNCLHISMVMLKRYRVCAQGFEIHGSAAPRKKKNTEIHGRKNRGIKKKKRGLRMLILFLNKDAATLPFCSFLWNLFFCNITWKLIRARSQIPVLSLTGWAQGGRTAVPGGGFSGQNLRIKYIPCVGTHLWITMPAKSTSSYTKSTCVNRSNWYS